MEGNDRGRQALEEWQKAIKASGYDADFAHSVSLYRPHLSKELKAFGDKVVQELEPLVQENNLAGNLPRLEKYDGIGEPVDEVVHHPSYEQAGNIIYGSKLLERLSKTGGLLDALSFMYLSSQAGEAGHNCPLACSAGIIRVLQKVKNVPNTELFIKKLIDSSYTTNFTGAQFITEVQGGSDVGLNATQAHQDEKGNWRIKGEKWFCSNADAELILLTARFDPKLEGTKGLGLFLVPKTVEGKPNSYRLRRLKDKIGTRSMASSEIDFNDAIAYPVGELKDGFKLMMENVLHISRLFNTFCVLGMVKRAYVVASEYAKHRVAFGHPIVEYPLVQENLSEIRSENSALLASIFSVADLQDQLDKDPKEEQKLLLRLLANLNKYISALWSVNHLHHALDVLAGNGAIESFSPIPRLLRDAIVCENWEGTHNTLRMQILKDISKYKVDQIFINHLNPTHPALKKGLEKLKETLKDIENPLAIKSIVDQMAILYAATQLEKEAKTSTSKQNQFEYFLHLHFEKQPDVLTLIKSISSN
jgi:alkylation response protein AidB-like acyl-CoA dehydrogenase